MSDQPLLEEGSEVSFNGSAHRVLKLNQDDVLQPRVRLQPLPDGRTVWCKVADLDGYGDVVDKELIAIKLVLRATDPAHIEAWNTILRNVTSPVFDGLSDNERTQMIEAFEIQQVDIFEGCTCTEKDALAAVGAPQDSAWAVVSPANSFGDMTGGIDAVYLKRWPDVMKRLQLRIHQERDGELVVGDALIINTSEEVNAKEKVRYCIAAPTMRVPLDVRGTCNSYLCFRAMLVAVRRHNTAAKESTGGGEQISTVLCPMLATGVGLIPPRTCAYQMGMAYRQQVLKRKGCFESAIIDHQELVKKR